MTKTAIISITKPLELTIVKEINSMWYADLTIEKDDYIAPECYVEFEDELYIARKPKKIIDEGIIKFQIYLEHIMSELVDFELEPFDTTDTAENLLTTFLTGTGWSVGTVNVAGSENINTSKRITVLSALNLMASVFDGELYFHSSNRTVDLKTEIGVNNGIQIRIDKNTDYISDEEDTIPLVTRLYVYGKDGLTIANVNPTGKEYIDSTHIGDYKLTKTHTEYEYAIEDEDELYQFAQDYLADHETPNCKYVANTYDLTSIPTWANEIIGLGDTLRIYNKDINLKEDARAKKIIRDGIDPKKFRIELEGKQVNISENVADMSKDIDEIKDKIENTVAIKPPTFTFIIPGYLAVDDMPCVPIPVPYNCTIGSIYAYVDEAPVGNDIILDIFLADDDGDNAHSIWDNPLHKPQIDDGDHFGYVTNGHINSVDRSPAQNKIIYPKTLQVGDMATPGADINIEVRFL